MRRNRWRTCATFIYKTIDKVRLRRRWFLRAFTLSRVPHIRTYQIQPEFYARKRRHGCVRMDQKLMIPYCYSLLIFFFCYLRRQSLKNLRLHPFTITSNQDELWHDCFASKYATNDGVGFQMWARNMLDNRGWSGTNFTSTVKFAVPDNPLLGAGMGVVSSTQAEFLPIFC